MSSWDYEVYGGTYKPIDMEKIDALYESGKIDHNDWIKYFKMTPEWQAKKAIVNGKLKRRGNKKPSS